MFCGSRWTEIVTPEASSQVVHHLTMEMILKPKQVEDLSDPVRTYDRSILVVMLALVGWVSTM